MSVMRVAQGIYTAMAKEDFVNVKGELSLTGLCPHNGRYNTNFTYARCLHEAQHGGAKPGEIDHRKASLAHKETPGFMS